MAGSTMQAPSHPLVEQFREITPGQFGSSLNQLWASAERIKDTVIKEVEADNLPTLVGLGIVSCVTGQTFGYQWFHGQPSPADIAGLYTNQQ